MIRPLLTGSLVFALGCLPLPAATPAAAESVIDTTPVLRVGSLTVSAYAWAKNERLYREQIRQALGREPTDTELADWRALFRAKLTLLADAEARGYFSRPDLLAATRQMEEYMLTQPEGPFYASLYPSTPAYDARLRALHELNRRVLDVASAWFDSATEADRTLGADFAQQSTDEKLRRLHAARDNPHARYFAGRMTWPCAPFPSLANEILAVVPGQWLGPTPGFEGVLHLFVRAAHDQEIPDFAPRRDAIAAFVREFDRDCVRQRRRAEVLRQARLEWDDAIASRVIAGLASGVDATGHLVGPALQDLGELPLARYRWDDTPVILTVGDWQGWFNGQLARRVPQSAADIGESLRALVQTRYDLRDAARAGVASHPQFVEDRANFLRNQVLAAYERELLMPDRPMREEAAPLVRRELERAARDQRTLQRARELAPRFSSVDISTAAVPAAAPVP